MWFWAISAIAGSILGSATDSWFRDTKLGVWFYAKMDSLYTWASKRYGVKLLTDEQKRMAKFPELSRRLTNIETRLGVLDGKEVEQRGVDDNKNAL